MSAQKIGQLEEQLRQEREARETLAAQVAALLHKKSPARLRQRKSNTEQGNI